MQNIAGRKLGPTGVCLAILAVLAIACYRSVTDVGIWSDDYALLQPTEAQYYLPWNFHDSNRAYWRPGSDLLMTTLARMAGRSTWPFLVFSLATHACLVWLIYLFAQRMGARSWGACLSAAFFLTSSAHQEAVLWTAASVMTPALILMLLSVWAHTSLGVPTRRRSLLALLTASASLLFRESGYVLPLLFVASTLFLWPRRTWRSGLGTAAILLVVCCCHYLFLNRVVGGQIGLNPISVMGRIGNVYCELLGLPRGLAIEVCTAIYLAIAIGSHCGGTRVRFLLVWVAVSPFPYCFVEMGERHAALMTVPLSVLLGFSLSQLRHGTIRSILLAALITVIGYNALVSTPAKVQLCALYTENCSGIVRSLEDITSRGEIGNASTVVVDVVPQGAVNAVPAILKGLGVEANFVDLTTVPRPPFAVCAIPPPRGAVYLRWDEATHAYEDVKLASLFRGLAPVPILTFVESVEPTKDLHAADMQIAAHALETHGSPRRTYSSDLPVSTRFGVGRLDRAILDRSGRVWVEVSCESGGFLVFTSPVVGCRVEILLDSEPVQGVRCGTVSVGVSVPAGSHTVHFFLRRG